MQRYRFYGFIVVRTQQHPLPKLMTFGGTMSTEDAELVLYRYKYREFDNNDGNLKIITEGSLRFSSPLDFNDPFDSSPAYAPTSIEQLYKTRPDLIKRVADAMGYSPADRITNKGKLLRNAQRTVETEDFSKAIMSTVGVFCLSRTPTNPLMWAHYANDHKGFLVELKIPIDFFDDEVDSLFPHPVDYSQNRPILNWGQPRERIEPYFLTKSSDWQYEEEERLLNVEQGPGIYPYPREKFLSSVTAGLRTNDTDYDKLRKAVDKASAQIEREIPLYRAKLSPNRYKVYIPDHPDPQVSSPE